MEGVTTRSRSQGDKEEKEEKESNMAAPYKDMSDNFKGKVNCTKAKDKSGVDNNESDEDSNQSFEENAEKDSDNAVKQKKPLNAAQGDIDHDNTGISKGIVANRIDKINSTPNTPVAKMPKVKTVKSVAKNRTLVAKNGQLGLQEAVPMLLKSTEEQNSKDNEEDSMMLTSILRELSVTVKKLEKQLDRMDKDRKATDDKVSKVEYVQQQEVVRVQGLMDQVDKQQDKIDALIDTVVRQDQQIQALTNQVNTAYAMKNQKNIIINGIPETQGENCLHEVAHFFKYALKLDKINLKYARRMGKGQYKPMLVRLANFNDKIAIFQNMDKLKQYNQGKQKPCFITDHLPEAWAERKKVIHYMKQQNKKLPTSQQFKASVKNNTLFFDEKEYKAPIVAPTVSQFLNLSAERKKVIRELKTIKGEEETKSESIFIGYATEVFTLKQVEDYYYHVRLLSPEATHVMCAYKLPGVDFTTTLGGIDDGEHGASRTLMNLLLKNAMVNKAVFVVRYYGGKHLGPLRFTAIENAAQSALDKLTQHLIEMRKPPTQQELDDFRARMAEFQQATSVPVPQQWSNQDEATEREDESQEEDVQSITSQESLH